MLDETADGVENELILPEKKPKSKDIKLVDEEEPEVCFLI